MVAELPKNHNRATKGGPYISFHFLFIDFISDVMLAYWRLTDFIHGLLMLIDNFYIKSFGSQDTELKSNLVSYWSILGPTRSLSPKQMKNVF